MGSTGRTVYGAEINQGLIENVGFTRRKYGFSQLPDPFIHDRTQGIPADPKDTTENPADIRVNNGGILVERETENRASGISANARKGGEFIYRIGEFSVSRPCDNLGDLMQSLRSKVVTERAP